MASSSKSFSTTASAALALSFGATPSSRSARRSISAERSIARSAARAWAASRNAEDLSQFLSPQSWLPIEAGERLCPRPPRQPAAAPRAPNPAVAASGRRRARLQGRAQSRGVRRSRWRRSSFPPSRHWRRAAEARQPGAESARRCRQAPAHLSCRRTIASSGPMVAPAASATSSTSFPARLCASGMARRSQAGIAVSGAAAVAPGSVPWWRGEGLGRRTVRSRMNHGGAFGNRIERNPPRLYLLLGRASNQH